VVFPVLLLFFSWWTNFRAQIQGASGPPITFFRLTVLIADRIHSPFELCVLSLPLDGTHSSISIKHTHTVTHTHHRIYIRPKRRKKSFVNWAIRLVLVFSSFLLSQRQKTGFKSGKEEATSFRASGVLNSINYDFYAMAINKWFNSLNSFPAFARWHCHVPNSILIKQFRATAPLCVCIWRHCWGRRFLKTVETP